MKTGKTEGDLINAVSRTNKAMDDLRQQIETYREFCVCNPDHTNAIVNEIYDLARGIEAEVSVLSQLQLAKTYIKDGTARAA